MLRFLMRRRRAAIRQRPLPSAWREFIDKNVPYATRLSSEDRDELFGHVQVFLAEKRFERSWCAIALATTAT
jgi:Mlc titration factor MtfA (ptsG expression regulator)